MHRWRWLVVMGSLFGGIAGAFSWASGRQPDGAELLENTTREATTRSLEPGDSLTVVTWNIHYGGGPTLEVGRGQSRAEVTAWLDDIAHHLRTWDADIVALQEVDRGATRSYDIDQLTWLQQAAGYPHAAWTPTWDAAWIPHPGLDPRSQIGRVHSGQAVLSRFPLTNATRTALPQPSGNGTIYNLFYLHRALTQVTARLGPTRSLRIVNAHLEAFDPQNRMDHADRTIAHMGPVAPHTLLLGDMNCVPPEAKLRKGFPDEPETDMSTDDTIARLRGIDGMREVVPTQVYEAQEATWFTFPASAPNRRLDYLFHADGLTLSSAQVPSMQTPPSDHLPVVATFRLE